MTPFRSWSSAATLTLRIRPAILAALAALAPAAAGADAWRFGDESAALAEGPASLAFNPAALGFRYREEMALSMRQSDVGRDAYRGTLLRGGAAFGLFGAAREKLGWETALAGGSERSRLGWMASWIPTRGGRRTDHRLGWLAHPAPWAAIGAVADHLGRPRIDGVRLEREYTAALGVRPLALGRRRAHRDGPRLTLTADARVREDQHLEDARLRFGAELEPVDGLRLRGSWVAREKSFQIGVSLLAVRAGYHGAAGYREDRGRRHLTHSLSFHVDEDRTVFAGAHDRRVAVVQAAGDLSDDALNGFSIYGPVHTVSSAPLHRRLERALEDPLTRGVLLEVRGVANLAQIEELRPRIARLRAAGKPVVAFLPGGGGRGSLYLAAACDRIVTTPEAFWAGLGLRAERRYYRRALADWGVRIDRVSDGKYKSAYRGFSADSTPPADREAIEHNLDVVQDLFVDAVVADRAMDRDRLLTLLDGRRWPPSEMRKAGLIDSVGYREHALGMLQQLIGAKRKPRAEPLDRPEARRAWAVPSRIAVVYATGAIESGRSGNDLLLGPYMGSETLGRQIESAFKRRDVEAVVLRVESPGGSSLASDLIHHALVEARGTGKKPLIVSMGSSAASGGYHISLPAQKIFADRFTRTGSIGVVFVKPSIEGWYRQHEVRQDVFERGRYMRALSLGEDWDAEIQAAADSANRKEYREFVSLVARSRNLTDAEAEAAAQGRVWLGEDALRHRLVDAIGGLEEAIAEARRRIGSPPEEELALVEYRRPRPGLVDRVVSSVVGDTWRRLAHLPRSGEPLYWMEAEWLE